MADVGGGKSDKNSHEKEEDKTDQFSSNGEASCGHTWHINAGYEADKNDHAKNAQADPESSSDKEVPLHFEQASWISQLNLWWFIDIIKEIRSGRYKMEKVSTPKSHQSAHITKKLSIEWKKEANKKSPSLMKAVIRTLWKSVLPLVPLFFFYGGTLLAQPPMISYIVNYLLGDPDISTTSAVLMACGIVFTSLLFCYVNRLCFHQSCMTGSRTRAALTGFIYQKVLSIDTQTRYQVNTGRIINMMASDLEAVIQVFIAVPNCWITPVTTIAAFILICLEFGLPGLGAVFFFCVLFIFYFFVCQIVGKIKMKTAEKTDKRVNLMNEIIMGINVIKMYCWEKPFKEQIQELRRKELSVMFGSLMLQGSIQSGFFINGRVAAYIVFLCYTLLGGILTAGKAVKLIGYVEVLQMMWLHFVYCIADIMETVTSLSRIQEFLMLPDCNVKSNDPNNEPETIKHTDMKTSWDYQADTMYTLNSGTFACDKGDLIIVVGEVGSGKTSYLMALLGEMTLIEGTLTPVNSVSYSPQEPWVMSTSFRENILFGSSMERDRYTNVVAVCGLEKDISLFPYGDMTLVGERGLTLSGGQKSRLCLARALYQKSNIYLLDDPLAAVDPLVGQHIFNNAICEFLGGKTRVLVTHQLQYIDQASQVLVFEQGQCIYKGSPDKLKKDELYKHIVNYANQKEENKDDVQQGGLWDKKTSEDDIDEGFKEESEIGTVSWNVYWDYFLAGKGFLWFTLYLLLAIPMQICYIISDWWLSIWTEYNKAYINNNSTAVNLFIEAEDHFHIKVYTGILAALIILALGKQIFFFAFTTTASKNLHSEMFKYVLGTRISFFETRPVGIILNKFSRDLGFVDLLLSRLASIMFSQLLNFVGFVVFVGVVSPYVLCATVPYVIMTLMLRQVVLSAGREIKRIEATKRSPLYSHVSASLEGHTVIRAFTKEAEFLKTFHHLQDKHTVSWILFITCYRFMGLWISIMSSVYMLVIILVSFLLRDSGVDGTLVGFALVYNIIMVNFVQYLVLLSAEVENVMTSVERIMAYSSLEIEEKQEIKSRNLKDAWPKSGSIKFSHVSLNYNAGENKVLDDIRFDIQGGEKIGIIGRTGAGKSSLFKSLLRLVETEGVISIDGIDIKELSLEEVRKSISVIPQDPVLFTGTLRSNIDPFSDYDDQTLWKVLEQVQLKEFTQAQSAGLMYKVEEGGGNFSVGQKQLVCLARAMLRNNKILIIDEATANVDHRTDELIQETIRNNFRLCTVLTIAHRINTIIDSDRIMEMENGRIIKFGKPDEILGDIS